MIRDAVLADAGEIARLTTELGYSANEAEISGRLAKILGREDQLVLVAISGAEIAGWLQAHASDVLESGFRVEIVGLIVGENHRRAGVGRNLVQRAEKWAEKLGAASVVVRSNTLRSASHQFYPALGFTASKTQAVYRKSLD